MTGRSLRSILIGLFIATACFAFMETAAAQVPGDPALSFDAPVNPPINQLQSNASSNNSGPIVGQPEPQRWFNGYLIIEDTLINVLTLFLTIVATGLLIGTLKASNKAVETGQLALEESQKATTEATRIGEAQVRAYITFDEVRVLPAGAKDDWVFFIVNVSVRNCGQSPARAVLVQAVEEWTASKDVFGNRMRDLASDDFDDCEVKLMLKSSEVKWNRETEVRLMIKVTAIYRDVFAEAESDRLVEQSIFKATFDKASDVPVVMKQVVSYNTGERSIPSTTDEIERKG